MRLTVDSGSHSMTFYFEGEDESMDVAIAFDHIVDIEKLWEQEPDVIEFWKMFQSQLSNLAIARGELQAAKGDF